MNFLLDTNVVSEWVKPRPHPGVVRWLADADEDRLFLSVITLAELRRGVDRLPDGSRKSRLDAWITQELPARFVRRILPVDSAVADAWGRLTVRAHRAGRSINAMDAFIAATTEAYGLTLVTRNTEDFHYVVQAILNPWQE